MAVLHHYNQEKALRFGLGRFIAACRVLHTAARNGISFGEQHRETGIDARFSIV
jgi:hypothetical protein